MARRCASVASPIRKSQAKPPAGYIAVVEKDCLRCGKWDTDSGPWKVTPAVLDDIAGQYKLYREAGYKSHYVWNHDEDAEKKLGVDVLKLVRRGNELVAILGVKSAKALSAIKEHDQVSVYVDRHVDGVGNRYSQLLKHIGMVHHPVVNHQRPHKRLLSRNPSMKKNAPAKGKGRRLAAEGEEGGEGEGGGSETSMEVKAVVALLNEHFQVSIPDKVDTVKELDIALEMMAKGADPAAAADPEETVEDAEAAVADPMAEPVMASRGKQTPAEKRLAAELAAAKKTIADEKARQLSTAKTTFVGECAELVRLEKITAGERAELEKEGEASGWRLSILSGYKRLPGGNAKTGYKPTARRAATPNAPGGQAERNPAEIAEAIIGRKLSTSATAKN